MPTWAKPARERIGAVTIAALALMCLASVPGLVAGASSTLDGVFTKITTTAEGSDTLSGQFWYFEDGSITFAIDRPIRQRMVIRQNQTAIYYPGRALGFLLTSDVPVLAPLVPGLVAASKWDAGLSALGYDLDSYDAIADTVLSRWRHTKLGDRGGTYLLTRVADQLVSVEWRTPDETRNRMTEFSNYTTVDGVSFPTVIRSRPLESDGVEEELVYLHRLTRGLNAADSLRTLDFPRGTKIMRRQW